MPKRHSEASFEVRASTIPGAGLGLFARVPIGLEETIGFYTGEVITADELNAGKFAGSHYLLFVTRHHIIVGEGPKANYTRFINHSAEPNAFLITSTRWKSARFEAIESIAPGQEIFFDYGDEFAIG
ncbi:MAG: SET domain-containing protein-lysine N-methyltransferase [Verrucomicrobiales bacterium]